MAKEKGMGKGLSALLGEDFSADFSTPSSTLPISQIESCQNQPRKSIRSSPASGGGGPRVWRGWKRSLLLSLRQTIRRLWSWP